MRLRRLVLTDVAGVASAELVVPEEGVSVVLAPNETGKSTLLNAYRLLLTGPGHTGKGREVRVLKPVGRDVGSTIAAELVIGDETFEVERTYNKRAASSLTVRGARTVTRTSREADELLTSRFRELVDQDLYALLTFEQGRTLDPLPGAASETVMGALREQDAGAAPSGGGDTILEALRARAGRAFHARNGTPIGELKKLLAQAEDAEAQRDDVAAQVDAIMGGADADVSPAVEGLEAELADVTARLRRATAAAEAVTARRLLDATTEQARQRQAQVETLDRCVTEEKELSERVAAAEQALASLDQQVRSLEQRATDAAQERAARLAAAAQAEADLLAALGRAQRSLEAELAKEKVDAALITRARALERDVEIAEASLAGGAWELVARAGRALTVEVDGERVAVEEGTSLERAVSASFVLSEDDGTVIDLHADADRRSTVEKLSTSTAALRELLADVDVPDVAALEDRLVAREELADRIDELARYQQELQDDAVAEELPAADAEAGSDIDELEAAHVAALEALAAIGADGDTALADAKVAHTQAQQALEQRQEELQRSVERRAAAEAVLTEARSSRSDEALGEEVTKAAAALEKLGDVGDVEDVGMLEQKREALAAELEAARRAADRAADRRSIVGALTTTLETLEGTALTLREQFERELREAEAARTLLGRLESARADQGDRYREPLEERIGELLTRLYGFDCDVELDDDLRIVQRADADGRMIPWEQLSGGAKEQAAVVTGLAIAELAGDGGVPFWIDDAIVFTDDDRVEGLKELLAESTAQVIVLTCRAELAEGLPAARLTIAGG